MTPPGARTPSPGPRSSGPAGHGSGVAAYGSSWFGDQGPSADRFPGRDYWVSPITRLLPYCVRVWYCAGPEPSPRYGKRETERGPPVLADIPANGPGHDQAPGRASLTKASEHAVLLLWRALAAFRCGRHSACQATGKPPAAGDRCTSGAPRWDGPDDHYAVMDGTPRRRPSSAAPRGRAAGSLDRYPPSCGTSAPGRRTACYPWPVSRAHSPNRRRSAPTVACRANAAESPRSSESQHA